MQRWVSGILEPPRNNLPSPINEKRRDALPAAGILLRAQDSEGRCHVKAMDRVEAIVCVGTARVFTGDVDSWALAIVEGKVPPQQIL